MIWKIEEHKVSVPVVRVAEREKSGRKTGENSGPKTPKARGRDMTPDSGKSVSDGEDAEGGLSDSPEKRIVHSQRRSAKELEKETSVWKKMALPWGEPVSRKRGTGEEWG